MGGIHPWITFAFPRYFWYFYLWSEDYLDDSSGFRKKVKSIIVFLVNN